MTEEELAHLIAEGEGPYLDFKAARVKPATLARTLVAFANSGGGRVVIGVDDHLHHPSRASQSQPDENAALWDFAGPGYRSP